MTRPVNLKQTKQLWTGPKTQNTNQWKGSDAYRLRHNNTAKRAARNSNRFMGRASPTRRPPTSFFVQFSLVHNQPFISSARAGVVGGVIIDKVMQQDYATADIDLVEAETSRRSPGSSFPTNCYSAKRMRKPVSLFYQSAQARTVFVLGDFNDWSRTSHPMQRQPDGGWTIQIPLHHGHHRYLILVDGAPALDSNALGTARGPRGEKVSLIAVS